MPTPRPLRRQDRARPPFDERHALEVALGHELGSEGAGVLEAGNHVGELGGEDDRVDVGELAADAPDLASGRRHPGRGRATTVGTGAAVDLLEALLGLGQGVVDRPGEVGVEQQDAEGPGLVDLAAVRAQERIVGTAGHQHAAPAGGIGSGSTAPRRRAVMSTRSRQRPMVRNRQPSSWSRTVSVSPPTRATRSLTNWKSRCGPQGSCSCGRGCRARGRSGSAPPTPRWRAPRAGPGVLPGQPQGPDHRRRVVGVVGQQFGGGPEVDRAAVAVGELRPVPRGRGPWRRGATAPTRSSLTSATMRWT